MRSAPPCRNPRARVLEASGALEAAQVDARRAAEQQGELGRRRQRAEREVHDADALDRASRRSAANALTEQVARLDDEGRTLGESLAVRAEAAARAREELTIAERAQEEAREARTTAQVEEAQTQARVQVANDREHRLAQEQQTAAARLDSLRAELSDLSQADSALAEQMASWQLDLETREATLADGEGRLETAEGGVQTRRRESDERRARARRRASSVAEPQRRAASRRASPHGARRSSRGHSRAARDRVASSARRHARRSADRWSSTTTRCAPKPNRMRQELERLGPVNVLAIEEHEETVKRQDFLTGQRADLAEAKQSLLQAIREIDGTARELFLATFTQVRENFRQIFMSLFGGGECDLRLENPDAPLDCDIEIHASPRGKRTQRIHLLSSGERALVALSLLFGIFLTKPSPFCLLDEVDAPLDDANVGRFVRMLTQFKTRTQFIVITHNPRTTTEAADAVYGVTMQEPGVSSLVSVRMRGAPSVDDALAGLGVDTAVPTTV